MAPVTDPLRGPRLALVVATSTYTDPGLRQLRDPAQDADALAQVLADPGIGGFAVESVIDQPAHQVRLAIEGFLADRGTGDLLLVYLSCHGELDARRRLYFAATDTRKDRLGSTGVEAAWVLDQLEHCRARRQVLILDCCFSGAFAHGAKGEADLGLQDRFLGQGRGRVVLTASTATEYSFEGDPNDAAIPAGSVFTAALVRGLRTGAADTDHDGHVSVDDAYAYVFDQVQAAGAAQTPQRWQYGAEGKILLARSPAGPAITPAPLPESLRAGLDSPHPGIRIGAVTELGEWLTGGDPARAATARRHLQEVADNDIPRVAHIARILLDTETTAEPPTSERRDREEDGRYSRALEQIGSANLDVRIGGIYALEGIALDSPRNHPTVMEVLTAFIRERSRKQPYVAGPESVWGDRWPDTDVQVALTVVGRRKAEHDDDTRTIALAGTDLAGADLTGAVLTGANLTGANLTRADLTRADLAGADLASARLTGADLTGARLTDADLTGARLTGARLTDADLTGARLTDADLTGARLTGARLTDAFWPESVPVPMGWTRADSGRIRRVTI
jgi:hypothetical protein